MLTKEGSNDALAYPIAHSTRPQLASAPNIAAFTSDEEQMDMASVSAVASSLAPLTAHVIRRSAPSPSAAIIFASSSMT